MSDPLYLGFDLSTQQLKVCAVNKNLKVIFEEFVSFDDHLNYDTQYGVHYNKINEDIVTTPVTMLIDALDVLMEKLKANSFPFSKVVGISGAAQQHGSVYWKNNAIKVLNNLDSNNTLLSQLRTQFSKVDCPMWMDMSTEKECNEREEKLGGALNLAKLTGSRSYHRFTGNQIRKIYLDTPDIYNDCERISLFSSFLTSVFMGKYAGIELSDASGMNLLDISKLEWDQQCLDCTAPNLKTKLGELLEGGSVVGSIGRYFVERFGFCKDCKVICFTGDNPASFVGMRLNAGDVALSLGTSDTVFLSIAKNSASCSVSGHTLVSPFADDNVMGMLCFKNGSCTRNYFKERLCDSWDDFSQSLRSTPSGNDGNIGFYFNNKEIIPRNAKGIYRFNKENEKAETFEKHTELRAVIEAQIFSRKIHAVNLGWSPEGNGKLIVTGGPSKNIDILQIIADVFNMEVYVLDVSNSASLGGAYLALWQRKQDFLELTKTASEPTLKCSPNPKTAVIYSHMMQRYKALENEIVKLC